MKMYWISTLLLFKLFFGDIVRLGLSFIIFFLIFQCYNDMTYHSLSPKSKRYFKMNLLRTTNWQQSHRIPAHRTQILQKYNRLHIILMIFMCHITTNQPTTHDWWNTKTKIYHYNDVDFNTYIIYYVKIYSRRKL